ncbi:MAG: BACON domain-containing protein [Prevotellaceae bacterium]|jgi:hypothetical protein|nr:BACON domain-containing protein [Prevotellaceae bacterium]
MIIEVPDIFIAKNGSFHSLRGEAVAQDGFKTFGVGSGMAKGGNWYVLKDNTPPVTYAIFLTVYLINATVSGGNYSLGMNSVGGGWSVLSKPSWVTLTKNNGSAGVTSVTVNVAANTGTSTRNGTVVFVHAEDSTVTASLAIAQAAGSEPLQPIYVDVVPVYDGQGYGLQARATVRDGVAPMPLSAAFRLHAVTGGNNGIWVDFSVTIGSGESTMLSNWANVGTLFGFVNDGVLVSQNPAAYLGREIIWEIYHEGQ